MGERPGNEDEKGAVVFRVRLVDNSFDVILKKYENIDDALARPFQRIGGDTLRDAFDLNFAAEGPGWTPLARRTVEERKRLGYGGDHPILEREGNLRNSVTDANDSNHIEEVVRVKEGVIHLHMGSSHPEYDLLHYGGPNQYGYWVPGRPMMVVHDAHYAELDAAWDRIVREGLDG